MAKKTAYWGLALILCLFMSFFAGRAALAAQETTEEETLTVVPTKGSEEATTEVTTEEPATRETMPPPPVTYYLPDEVAGVTKQLSQYYNAVATDSLMVSGAASTMPMP